MKNINRIKIYATLFMLLVIEIAVFKNLAIFGTRPELLLIFTVFFGFHFGIARGMEAGLVSGILKDVFSITGFGINIFSFIAIGFLAGFLKNKLIKENFITQFTFSMLSVLILSSVYFLYLAEIVKNDIGTGFWKVVLYKGLYTAIFAPFLFFIFTLVFSPKET
ncbi:MAG: rod shape-determining protein MreD [Candidatus Omnitrophica bacterium]|nr:rod shape-determining protein MreD [Candidatus Omnitrophota bacterium]